MSKTLLESLIYVLAIILSIIISAKANNIKLEEFPRQDQISKKALRDYGVVGKYFPIKEKSMLDEIMEKLDQAQKNGKLKELQDEFNKKAQKKIVRPVPVYGIKKARENRSWIYDPTYVQTSNIVDENGKIIISAGTTVNALDKLKMPSDLIFIDGDDKEQVNFAQKLNGKIILVKGAPMDLGQKLNRPVFFDQAGLLCKRFKIEAVPAIVTQEEKLLRIKEVRI